MLCRQILYEAPLEIHSTSAGQQLFDLRVHRLHEYRGSTGLWAMAFWKENKYMHTRIWAHVMHMECLHKYVIWYVYLYMNVYMLSICLCAGFPHWVAAHPLQNFSQSVTREIAGFWESYRRIGWYQKFPSFPLPGIAPRRRNWAQSYSKDWCIFLWCLRSHKNA